MNEEAKVKRQGQRLRRCDESIRELIKDIEGVSYGYIGNVWGDGTDDRSWSIFLPHPNRVGTAADRIGGHASDVRYKLVDQAHALKIGYELGRRK